MSPEKPAASAVGVVTRAAARRNLADVYRWLGWPIPNPNPVPGREFADRVRLATEDISTERR